MRFSKYLIVAILTTIFLSGCSFFDYIIYRPDINQGNYITETETSKLQIGQTKEQVLYILGTPMLKSAFGDDIWYYVFRENPNHGHVRQMTYTLTFNRAETLIDIKSDSIPHK
ncbi:MAG: outer membrane protein assembly factor BamE [Candidatus Schmidhempelia sp.]|nr:outer membrane protein assembly factor BamE [Candidatus Schmidhempelia sp.]